MTLVMYQMPGNDGSGLFQMSQDLGHVLPGLGIQDVFEHAEGFSLGLVFDDQWDPDGKYDDFLVFDLERGWF